MHKIQLDQMSLQMSRSTKAKRMNQVDKQIKVEPNGYLDIFHSQSKRSLNPKSEATASTNQK